MNLINNASWNHENFVYVVAGKVNRGDNPSKKMKELGELPNGWDFGIGYAPSISVQKKGLQICSQGKILGFEIEIRPQTFGGIVITLGFNDYFLDVFVDESQIISYCLEKGRGIEYEIIEEKDNIQIVDVVKKLEQIRKLFKCSSLELLTPKNIASKKNDSEVIVSKNMVTGFRFSGQNVLNQFQPVFVHT